MFLYKCVLTEKKYEQNLDCSCDLMELFNTKHSNPWVKWKLPVEFFLNYSI